VVFLDFFQRCKYVCASKNILINFRLGAEVYQTKRHLPSSTENKMLLEVYTNIFRLIA